MTLLTHGSHVAQPMSPPDTGLRSALLDAEVPAAVAVVAERSAPAPLRKGRPHSRRRARSKRARAFLRTHAGDLGLLVLALLCAALVAVCLTS